ncbi:MAG: DEAD/DEAH box helicase [Verrucomicrobiota bacterium]
MPFRHFGLSDHLLRNLEKAGYTRPTPVQSAAIPKVMAGGDVVGIAATGTGKTAAFVLPIIHHLSLNPQGKGPRAPHPIRALILAPTRELAIQIMDNIRSYGDGLPLRVAALFGGVEEVAQISALQRGVDIVVATPGRLMDLTEKNRVDFSQLKVLVLDEADRMLHMGFLPDIETIVEGLPRRRQTLMFSATFPKEVDSLARKFMHQAERIQLGKRTATADTVEQHIYEVPAHLKELLLQELLGKPGFDRVLVFVRMKDGANRLTAFLQSAGVSVARLHSSRSQEQRIKALEDFRTGKIRVLVATDIVARGIDIDGVTHVVNFDFPVNPEDYVHRIGRTGRAEAHGLAISLVPKGDLNLLGITEMAIGRRLDRKKLRGFDYFATTPNTPAAAPVKRDWRKRTRAMEAKKETKHDSNPAMPPKRGGPRPARKKPAAKRPKR